MLAPILAHVAADPAHFLAGAAGPLAAHLLSHSRHKLFAAGRVLALIFVGEAQAPALVACFQRDAGVTEALAREHALLEALADSSLAPRPLGLVRVGDRPVLFQEALAGPHASGQLAQAAADAPGSPEAVWSILAEQLAAAGRFLSRLQALPCAGVPASPHPDVAQMSGAYSASFGGASAEAQLLHDQLADYAAYLETTDPVWVHGDLTLSNLSLVAGTVRAFDWEYGGRHADRHSDAMHLAYYAFVSAYQHGLFPGQGFHQAFQNAFIHQNNAFAPMVRGLFPGLPEPRFRQALLACVVRDALLQEQVSLVFKPENRQFHRALTEAVLGYGLFREALAASDAAVTRLTAQLADESARRAASEAQVPALESRVADLSAERDALREAAASERAALMAQLSRLENELMGLTERHQALDLHARTLSEHLERINSRLVMRVYRKVRGALPGPEA